MVKSGVTVKEALHVLFVGHELVAVKVTVFVPPHALGAPVLLFVNDLLHPPLALAVANQVA